VLALAPPILVISLFKRCAGSSSNGSSIGRWTIFRSWSIPIRATLLEYDASKRIPNSLAVGHVRPEASQAPTWPCRIRARSASPGCHQRQTCYLEFLEILVDDELNTRDNKKLDKRLRAARFPVTKTLEESDFTFQPALDSKQIKALANCDFIAKHEAALFIGPRGVGKTHLATAIGVKACLRGYNVIFATIQHLASQLNTAMADLSVERLIDQYIGADLIILDELGFTPLNKIVADHIFRIVSERYERGSIIVTSNKPFELWAEMFVDPIW
jgi:DNA replication protein DnaC